jgi:hypothetical protein
MSRVLSHVRQNVVAYLALFVALGGTSYAAVSLPRNSVGARQIKNHSITPVKFNGKSIAGSISAWVILQWRTDTQLRARAASSHVVTRNTTEAETVMWPRRHFARDCAVSATPQENLNSTSPNIDGYLTVNFDPTNPSGAFLTIHGFSTRGTPMPQAATVLVVCP